MADGRLADDAALGEVAGADRPGGGGELSHDRKSNGIGNGLEELDVGIGCLHPGSISTAVNIGREEVLPACKSTQARRS